MSESRQLLSLEEIARRFDGAGTAWAVFAGAAATADGAARPLTDVEILVPAAERVRVMDLFPEAEPLFSQESTMILALPGFDIVAGLSLMDLDAEMAARRTRHEIDGVVMPVIPPEDNILLKAMWGRGPEESKHDWEDVQAMMASLTGLDWEYLRWRAGTFDCAHRAQEVLQRLEGLWRRSDQSQLGRASGGR